MQTSPNSSASLLPSSQPCLFVCLPLGVSHLGWQAQCHKEQPFGSANSSSCPALGNARQPHSGSSPTHLPSWDSSPAGEQHCAAQPPGREAGQGLSPAGGSTASLAQAASLPEQPHAAWLTGHSRSLWVTGMAPGCTSWRIRSSHPHQGHGWPARIQTA